VFNPAVGTIEGTVERQLITGGAGSVINGGNHDDGCYRTHWRLWVIVGDVLRSSSVLRLGDADCGRGGRDVESGTLAAGRTEG
jgi:hypothetical protein